MSDAISGRESPLPPPILSSPPPSPPHGGRRIEVRVRKPDGREVSCGKKWVTTCLKVLLVAVIVGGLIAASVFTFGAAGAFGAAAAASMGVTLAATTGAAGALYTTGGVLLTGAAIMIRLAYKHRMGSYTGHDSKDAKKFLAAGAKKIATVVAKKLKEQIKPSSSSSSESSGSDSDSEAAASPASDGASKKKEEAPSSHSTSRSKLAEVVRKIKKQEDVELPDGVKEFFKTVFETLRDVEDAEKNEDANKELAQVIDELQKLGKKSLSKKSRELIAQTFGVREWDEVLSESILPLLKDPAILTELGISLDRQRGRSRSPSPASDSD